MRTVAHLSKPTWLTGLLSRGLATNPYAVAVESGGEKLTYAQLEQQSNQLANLLRERGVGPNVLTGIVANRDAKMVVSLLGILKAGGAYVPIEPKHGSTRIRQILEESQVRIIIGSVGSAQRLGIDCGNVVVIDPSISLSKDVSDDPLVFEVQPNDLAYVIFTSGSTGKPKGVEIEHRSLTNFLLSMQNEPGFSSSDSLLSVTTLAFDIAALEIYLPLLAGGRLVIADNDSVSDGARLMHLIDSTGITVMQATPTTWRLLLASGWRGDRKLKVLVGGETLPVELARKLAKSCGAVWNMYGPTETTIWSSLYRVTGLEEKIVPIGYPIANTSLHVLDESLRPVTGNREGELYIGGVGLARGYLHRPDLTSERFVPDPFVGTQAKLYRTGDIARHRDDGAVEFLGRRDHQVKIRGFRIELGEIESVLEQHPATNQAVVVARQVGSGEQQLAAYVKWRAVAAATVAELQLWAREKLPEYMVPTAFIVLDQIPLTPNGKVDRNALPAPTRSDIRSGRPYVAPHNQIERRLVDIWEKELGIGRVGVTDNFFELGGRSLQAARLFMKIGKTFRTDLPLSILFSAPTIEKLALEIEPERANGAYRTVIPIQPLGAKAPFFCVHGGAGSTLFLQSLAKATGIERPFFGIEPEGLDGRRFKRTTIEQMAGHYLAEIRKVQPQGPYLIGGYCFGGIVAVEMAQQLQRIGEHASILALFSAPLRYHRFRALSPALSRSAAARFGRVIRSPGRVVRRHWRSARASLQMSVCEAFLNSGKRVPQMLRTQYVDLMLKQAEWSYFARFYAGNLHLFRGRGLYDSDPQMGWDGLAECLCDHVIGTGNTRMRREIMKEPLVVELASQLNDALDTAELRYLAAATTESVADCHKA